MSSSASTPAASPATPSPSKYGNPVFFMREAELLRYRAIMTLLAVTNAIDEDVEQKGTQIDHKTAAKNDKQAQIYRRLANLTDLLPRHHEVIAVVPAADLKTIQITASEEFKQGEDEFEDMLQETEQMPSKELVFANSPITHNIPLKKGGPMSRGCQPLKTEVDPVDKEELGEPGEVEEEEDCHAHIYASDYQGIDAGIARNDRPEAIVKYLDLVCLHVTAMLDLAAGKDTSSEIKEFMLDPWLEEHNGYLKSEPTKKPPAIDLRNYDIFEKAHLNLNETEVNVKKQHFKNIKVMKQKQKPGRYDRENGFSGNSHAESHLLNDVLHKRAGDKFVSTDDSKVKHLLLPPKDVLDKMEEVLRVLPDEQGKKILYPGNYTTWTATTLPANIPREAGLRILNYAEKTLRARLSKIIAQADVDTRRDLSSIRTAPGNDAIGTPRKKFGAPGNIFRRSSGGGVDRESPSSTGAASAPASALSIATSSPALPPEALARTPGSLNEKHGRNLPIHDKFLSLTEKAENDPGDQLAHRRNRQGFYDSPPRTPLAARLTIAASYDPIFVLHTSGSTGTPKPIIYTHEWVSRCFGSTTIPAVDGTVDFGHYITSGTLFLTLPPFHIAGVGLGLILALFHGYITAYPLPGPPPTTEALLTAISNTDIDWACVSPVVVDELGKREDLLNAAASRLKYIFYAGGSVPKASGDVVARKLPLWTILGSSEAGMMPLIHETRGYDNAEDWVYMRFNPALKSEMRHLHDDFYELVLVRNEGTESFQPVFTLFPADEEFRTRDLFRPHPSKDGLWRYHSRIDDVIVFLNGEKTNPISFEHQVTGHPEVKAVLVLGAQRFEAGLLVESTNDTQLTEKGKEAFIDRIWPMVQKANELTPAHARVARNKIVLVDPSKPMARAGKGTVQRATTLALYAAEIDQLYEQEEADDTPTERKTPAQSLRALVRNAVAEVVSIDDIDLFQLGLDSLGALRLQRVLKKILPNASISNSTVYNNPSVNALVSALEDVIAKVETSVTESGPQEANDAVGGAQEGMDEARMPKSTENTSIDELETVLKVFSEKVNAIAARQGTLALNLSTAGATILLTGTTGAIGSYVLDILLGRPDVAHVYCLNRTTDAQERQANNNQSRGLATDFSPERVTFLNGDLTESDFGLPAEDYTRLLESVTHVVHNAWPVNFSLPLAAFTPSIEGVVTLIQFAARSKRNSSLQFYSSIASVFNHPASEVAETIDDNLTSPLPGGYGQSKFVAERLVDQACSTLSIRGSVVRIGQIAGAARTASGWNRHEWLPSLVTTSAYIGALPDTLADGGDEVKWVPIDHLAAVLVELALIPDDSLLEADGAAVYHIEHPNPVTWSSILPVIKSSLDCSLDKSGVVKQPVQLVSYEQWLSVLRAKSLEAEQDANVDYAKLVRRIPGVKLIDFYEGLQDGAARGLNLALSMQRTCALSPSLPKMEPLEGSWIAGWVREWLEAAEA
ncbi:putative secondary metabolism biosynthetic enzyme [Didymella heteroderae]|uniref:Secondary metabolism biosynthetic enzyme n=1 Tax=Didymella heteroderae TaxID=1769908 RepID=A0A9P5C319_9PLEO|nr:putative secondary metabolism biosynthetic enzyme [Didymella heteroderae]